MKHSLKLVPTGAIVALILTACGPPDDEFVPLSDDDLGAITELFEETMGEVLLAGDNEAFAELFTVNGVQMPPNQPAVKGRPEILAWHEAADAVTQYVQEVVEVDGHDELAFVRGVFEITAAGADGEFSDRGKNVIVMEKVVEGSWKIVAAIWNSDLPLESGN